LLGPKEFEFKILESLPAGVDAVQAELRWMDYFDEQGLLFNMNKSTQGNPKLPSDIRLGRGTGAQIVALHMPQELLDAVDLRAQKRGLSRSELLRQMLSKAVA
jgi:hypothetical protein